jgi:hypothetical protein
MTKAVGLEGDDGRRDDGQGLAIPTPLRHFANKSPILAMSTETEQTTGSFTDTKGRRRRQVTSPGQCKGNSLQPQLEVLNGIRAHNQCFE